MNTAALAQSARAHLCFVLQPGSTLYVVRETVTRSARTRYFRAYAIMHDGIVPITQTLADALDLTTRQGRLGREIVYKGWGDDAAKQLTYELSIAIHGPIGKGKGFDPHAACDVSDAENYRAGYSLITVEL